VADRHAISRKGRTVTMATCATAVDPAWLVEQARCESRITGACIEDGELMVEVEHVLAGRVVETSQIPARGELAARAAAELAFGRKIWPDVRSDLEDAIEAFELYHRIHGTLQGTVPHPRDWLVQRLVELGVGGLEDLDLIGPRDLRFEGLSDDETMQLDRYWPRRLVVDQLVLEVSYDVDRKVVTLQRKGGSGRAVPNEKLLPAFKGFSVIYKDRGRTTRLR
jgi:hypothetical protein